MDVSNRDLNDRLCSIQSDLRNFAKNFDKLTSLVCDQSQKMNAIYGWLNQLNVGNVLFGEAKSASEVLSSLSAPSAADSLSTSDKPNTCLESEPIAIQVSRATKSASTAFSGTSCT